MHDLDGGVYSDSGSVLPAVHSCFAMVDSRSGSEVVGVATSADSAAVAALVGSEEACCLDSCCLGNPSLCGLEIHTCNMHQ